MQVLSLRVPGLRVPHLVHLYEASFTHDAFIPTWLKGSKGYIEYAIQDPI